MVKKSKKTKTTVQIPRGMRAKLEKHRSNYSQYGLYKGKKRKGVIMVEY